MSEHGVSIKNGMRILVRHPQSGIALFAKTLAENLDSIEWMNDEYKLRLCIMFVENLIDGSIENNVDPKIIKKIVDKPFTYGIKILNQRPREGMKYIVAIIMLEIREKQHWGLDDQFKFYDELRSNLFPGLKDV